MGDSGAGSAKEAPPPLGSLAARATVTYAAAPSAVAAPAAPGGDTSRRPPPVSAAGTRAVPGRNKITLEKGFSQVDWMRLTKTHPDLAGLGGSAPRTFTLAEVREHNTMEDFWTVLDGRVYNLTPYVPFHPGGQPILKQSAGRDCSALFRKYHPWVNAHFMLAKCLLGKLHESELGALPAGNAKAGDDDDDEEQDEDDAA